MFGNRKGFVGGVFRLLSRLTVFVFPGLRNLSEKQILARHYSLGYIYKRIREIHKQDGWYGVYDKIKVFFPVIDRIIHKLGLIDWLQKNRNKKQASHGVDGHHALSASVFSYCFSNREFIDESRWILIVAEVTLPQCLKYRVQQKQKYFERLGWQCKIVDWRDHDKVMTNLQFCHEVIFYRVPGFPRVIEQINESKRLGLSPWWEVDDLIFDKDLYQQCGFMETLPKKERDLLLFGSGLFRKAMLACDRAVASTTALAFYMRQAGMQQVYIIENALDAETCRIASSYYPVPEKKLPALKEKGEIVILYGSGTNTHNADFLVAADGLLAALQKEPSLCFWVVGTLDLPESFNRVKNQIKYIPSQSYEQYMGLLAQADIAIAPLEAIAFNDAKSNIKFLEASILGIPSVCSPQQAFREFIKEGENGFLASTKEMWEKKLLLLARDPYLRKQLGQAAYQDVLREYSPDQIMRKQVLPVFGNYRRPIKDKVKILMVNLYYDPYSYGGATLVAEAMAKNIQAREDKEVTIFTSRPFLENHKGLRRYKCHGSVVFSIDLPPTFSLMQQFNNLEMIEPFNRVLDAVQPDIVHFHAIQNFGLHLLYACQQRDIPYLVTLHDAWWLCPRQFMVKQDSRYCFQKKIDLAICQKCEPHILYLSERMTVMKEALQGAALLLSPSESHRQLYIANGIDKDLIRVNRNGIVQPVKERISRSVKKGLRFGFVAGNEVVKGYRLIRDAFTALQRSDWHLVIVDNKMHMGHPSIHVKSWKAQGEVSVVPPYNDETRDDFFNGIDVLLAPSQWQESYGMVVREALLRDVWVVCTHPGGQSEDVEDGVNGTYIPLSGGAGELRQAIETLLDRKDDFETYVNPHKNHIMTLKQQADELSGFYDQVMEEWGRKPPVS